MVWATGLKITDVQTIDLEPKTTGVSMAFGQTRQINAPTAKTCKGDERHGDEAIPTAPPTIS